MDNEQATLLDFEEQYQEQIKLSFWLRGRRYIGGFFIYLIYWGTIFGALKMTLGSNLPVDEDGSLVEGNIIESSTTYNSWGEHYIWFLIAFGLATYCSAILAGATAKKRGATVACLANLFILAPIFFLCFCIYTSRIEIESPTAWSILLPISILGSIFLAIFGGSKGEAWQNNMFNDKTMFGLRPIHWWWLIFPLNFTILTLIPKIRFILLSIGVGISASQTRNSILVFLIFVACATSIYFILWGWYKAFRLLSVDSIKILNRFKVTLKVLFYLFGISIIADVLLALVVIVISK